MKRALFGRVGIVRTGNPDGRWTMVFAAYVLLSIGAATLSSAAALQETVDVIVVRASPVSAGRGLEADSLPAPAQVIDATEIARRSPSSLATLLGAGFASVSLNDAQNNPLQPDLRYRGFTAAPLLGLAQGIAVYQDGVRVNAPLGDAIAWDLIPPSAIARVTLIGGANPLYGRNALGGALAVTTKDGFAFPDEVAQASYGSWNRFEAYAESGGNQGRLGYYVNASLFDEEGWRDASPSTALNLLGKLSFRDRERSLADLTMQWSDTELTGNGASPVGLLGQDRRAVFTAPDETLNELAQVTLNGAHRLTNRWELAGTAGYRRLRAEGFNGDASEFELCELPSGAVLLEDADEVEALLETALGIDLETECADGRSAVTSLAELEEMIEQRALTLGLDPEDFRLDDAGPLIGSGRLNDEAINNISERTETSWSLDGQANWSGSLSEWPAWLVLGLSGNEGSASFDADVELAGLDPVTRSTAGLGTGTFLASQATSVTTRTRSLGAYVLGTIDLTPRLTITTSVRFDETDVRLRDRSGERPELEGDHSFSRVNPALGIVYTWSDAAIGYVGYAEANRVPTPIELACNDAVFDAARDGAEAAGQDPDDIDFECRLPNAFLADPPLDDVVARSIELGARGVIPNLRYQFSLFRIDNEDDILFQTTGRATGLFANVGRTRRQGIEASVGGETDWWSWSADYTYLDASFQSAFRVLSPDHPGAGEDGTLAVSPGDDIPNLPTHQFKLAADWNATGAFSLGGDLRAFSELTLRGDEANALAPVGGYAVVDLRARWRPSRTVTVFLKLSNALGAEYESFGLLGERPNEVLPDVEDQRPVYLGPGPPRGGWVGIRAAF